MTASGNHIYALMGNSTDFAYSDLLFRTSNDGGTTFGKTISLSQNHKFMVGDTQMISSGNNVYITEDGSYWGSSNGAVLFMASHDNGSTFDHVTISNDTMVFAPQFAVSGNNVYIVWAEMKDQVTSIFLKKSTNGGIDFSDKIKLNTQNGDVRWPKLVLVNGTDGLSVEWTQTLQSGESKLFIVKSMDGGNTFGIPFDLGGFTTGNFDFSQIGVLENGTIYAIWTGEYDPSYSHSGVFFRTSTDGGKTFGNIFDLNSQNKSGISNPIVVSSQNHIYVAGDSGTFRASNDLGSTFTYVANLDTVKPSNASIAEPLFLVPEFKQDIPTLEPTNSQFSNSQNASFVLGQPNFVSNSQSP
ncbi:MAG: sialidase family protein, partial [Nitrosotalea sp.]